jgi:hypothetical protein
MLRAFFVVLIAVVMVGFAIVVATRFLGVPPLYPALAVAFIFIAGGLWWLRRG